MSGRVCCATDIDLHKLRSVLRAREGARVNKHIMGLLCLVVNNVMDMVNESDGGKSVGTAKYPGVIVCAMRAICITIRWLVVAWMCWPL